MSRPRYATATLDTDVLHVQLDRPERLNAVSEELYADLEESLAEADRDAVRAVLLTGAGRAFCAGADLKAHAERARGPAERRAYVWAGQRACRRLQTMPVPVVAAVQGYAIGAGAELALSADVVICTEDAVLRFPEVGLGTFVGGGASQRLPLSVGLLRAKQLLLLGRPLTGTEAAGVGLATEAVPPEGLLERARETAATLAALPRQSVRLMKEALGRAGSATLDEQLTFEAEALLACMGTEDWQAGIDDFGPGGRR